MPKARPSMPLADFIRNVQHELEDMEARLVKQAKRSKKPVFNPSNAVEVVHEDGSRLFFQSAFMIYKDHYFFVFTEHHGSHYYHEDDVNVYMYTHVVANKFPSGIAEKKG